MLGIILLIVGLIALTFTLLSLIGLDLGDLDISLGDSGVGLLGVLSPFLIGFGVIGGGLLTFGPTSTAVALLVGGATGVVFAICAFAILGYLVGAEEELPTVDLIGLPVRIVDPVGPDHIGSGEVRTPIGSRILSVTADSSYTHNQWVRVISQVEDREIYRVEAMDFDHDHPPR